MSRSFSTMWPSASMTFIKPPSESRSANGRRLFTFTAACQRAVGALDHLDDHVDQRRPPLVLDQLDRALDCRADLVRLGDRSLAGDAERARERREIDRWVFHLHADEFVFRRPAARDRDLLLVLNVVVVDAVVGHDREQRQAGVRGGPQLARRVGHLAVENTPVLLLKVVVVDAVVTDAGAPGLSALAGRPQLAVPSEHGCSATSQLPLLTVMT